MRANCWYGKTTVSVEEVPDPQILNQRDAIVKISSSQEQSFAVYPNPVATTITITGHLQSDDMLTASWYDTDGRLVKKEQWKQAAGSYAKTTMVTELPAGIYWLEVKGDTYRQKIKVFKQ